MASTPRTPADVQSGSPQSANQEADASAGGATSHKRRRISRACDDCRRKKIKCDGRQPCSSCAEFNSECTYEVPSKRSKSSRAPSAEDLEARLHLAESIIRKFLPHIDLQALEAVTSSPQLTSTCETAREEGFGPDRQATPGPAAESAKYIPVVQDQHHLRLTDSGEFDFHGLSSDAAFLNRITQHLPGLLRYDSRIPGLPSSTSSPSLPPISMGQSNYDYSKLPRRELARILCEYSFNHATCLLRIVHVPSFYKRFDSVYDAKKKRFTQDEEQFLGLLYSVLALGSMYDVDENDPSNPDHYNEAMRRGYKFYLGARLYLKDLAECRDLTTLQALLFIIQFLQAIGNLNSCYNLIGLALRSALRMGLHRNIEDPRMTPIESETRKRVFHTTRQMDIYLSTTLGLPVVLQSRDIDQPLPAPVDDANITADALLQHGSRTPSINEAFNAHAKLMDILAVVVECMYPSQGAIRKATHVTYMINFNQVRDVEHRLHTWYQHLPAVLRPGYNEDVYLHRVQILLRFAYAHVQMMLYRPFMQYMNHQDSSRKRTDQRYEALATAGISVCRNIINIGLEIRKQAVLIGPYWFIIYTQFFAVLCLVFHSSHKPDEPASSDILTDALLGKDAISGLNQRSLAADKLSATLEAVFDNLPQGLITQLQGIKNSMKFQSRTQSHTTSETHPYRMNHTNPGTFSGHQGRWQIPMTTTNAVTDMLGHMTVPLGNQPTHASSSMSTPSHVGADRLMFPLGDPIAYPSTLGGEPSIGTLTSSVEDTMQLIVPDFFDNFHHEQTGQPLDTSLSNQTSMSGLSPGTYQTVNPRYLDNPIARIFDDL
ncbi:Activator of stress protein [Paramyrothecium foliicola]|nr:Activator of stress protein [Paramyrothecium foliicola]